MKKIAFALLAAWLLMTAIIPVQADSPYNTWTWGPGYGLTMTQDAYSPYTEIDLPISGAEDLYITPDGAIYIADTGNGQIVKVAGNEVVASYGKDVLQGPTGIFVDAEGNLYVADAKKNTIVLMDAKGRLINEFGRPSEPLFGRNREFLPKKIAVDARKNLYIISEGSVNGIIQMNTNGNFIGYFGANTASMSLKMILQRLFLTPEQLEQFIKNEAASPSNIAIDHQSMVFTITAGTTRTESIRRFTVSGKNIFWDTFGSTTFRDIAVSENGLVVAVDSNGLIYEYELNGMLLFMFGAKDTGDQRMGTLRNPTGIGRHNEFLYVLDKEKNALVVYQTTDFARLVHEGVRLYMEGYYLEAKPYFDKVLDYNGAFIMAYQALADAYNQERDFSNALASYRYAEDRYGYSQAFWELRNDILQRYLGNAIIIFVALSLVQSVGKRLEKRYRWLDPSRRWFRDLQRIKLIDDFVFMFRFIKQPADSFYYIKKNMRGSLLFAMILYLWVIVARVLSLYVTGFIFSPFGQPSDVPVENEIATTLLLIVLWNAANYLISTISDGEGRISDVVIGSSYSLFPYALFALPIALISNVLSGNEVFIYTFSLNLMWFWTGLMLFIMVKEVHNYSVSETIRNILLTIFTMALFVLTGYILYVLFNQLFEFINAIIQEARLRV
jgi:tetratricopeptide (TPR) repeat protein